MCDCPAACRTGTAPSHRTSFIGARMGSALVGSGLHTRSAVYLAEHPGIGRTAAVKVLHPRAEQGRRHRDAVLQRGRAANAIHHPGIVEVFEFGTLPTGVSYIV